MVVLLESIFPVRDPKMCGSSEILIRKKVILFVNHLNVQDRRKFINSHVCNINTLFSRYKYINALNYFISKFTYFDFKDILIKSQKSFK